MEIWPSRTNAILDDQEANANFENTSIIEIIFWNKIFYKNKISGKFDQKIFSSKCLKRLGIQQIFLEKLCGVTSETLEFRPRDVFSRSLNRGAVLFLVLVRLQFDPRLADLLPRRHTCAARAACTN